MKGDCKLIADLDGNTSYRLRFCGIEVIEALPEGVVLQDENSLEKAAEDITSEIKNGTFNYIKWFPEGTLVAPNKNNSDKLISHYYPYLWRLINERIEFLEGRKSSIQEELNAAEDCRKAFLAGAE